MTDTDFLLNEGRGREAVRQFASIQHDNWRKGFDPEGTGKERIKKNSDGSEGNINVPFDKLHPDWQKENLAAGKAALMAIRKHKNNIEAASEHVHNEWMKRNPKADYNAAQHVPYSELPEAEKAKDREHVTTMQRLLGRKKLEEETLLETRIKLVKARIRGGKIQRRKKVSNVPGMTLRGGKLKRMSPTERRNRRMGQKRGKMKRRAKLARTLQKRKRSLQKRKTLGLG